MTLDVRRELEGYGRHAESAAPPISLESVIAGRRAPAPLMSPTAVPRPLRGLAIALAAAVITFLVMGVIALLGPDGAEQPVVDTLPPSTTPATVPDDLGPASTIAAAPVESLVWSRMADSAFDVPGRIEGLGSTVIGWLAVGSSEDSTPAIWVAADGTSWSMVDSEAFTGLRGELRAVAEHTGRLVVVGMDLDDDVPAFWYSNGGLDWTRINDVAVSHPGAEVHDVLVHLSAAYVAVGTDVWTSANGIEWQRIDLDGTAYSLMEFPDGLLAAGIDAAGQQAAAWISRDLGNTWNPIAVESRADRFESSAIHAMATTDDGYLAAGAVSRGGITHPAVWQSDDGDQWELVWVDEEAEGSFESVAHTTGQTVAVGETSQGGAVWLSGDSGDTWVRYEDRLELFVADQAGLGVVRAAEGGSFVTAGERGGQPAVWVGIPPEPIPEVDAEGRPLIGWTCQARIDNDAVWELGAWDEEAGHYVASGVTPCLDLLDTHLEPQAWKVEWEGKANTLEVGFLLWFERGLHGTIYAEKEITEESGTWLTPTVEPDPEAPFVWVAMPHSFDDWQEITWTITPCGSSDCG